MAMFGKKKKKQEVDDEFDDSDEELDEDEETEDEEETEAVEQQRRIKKEIRQPREAEQLSKEDISDLIVGNLVKQTDSLQRTIQLFQIFKDMK